MEQLLLRPIETARVLGLGRATTYRLLASGEIPSIKVGRSVRVSAEALRQWIAARQIDANKKPSAAN